MAGNGVYRGAVAVTYAHLDVEDARADLAPAGDQGALVTPEASDETRTAPKGRLCCDAYPEARLVTVPRQAGSHATSMGDVTGIQAAADRAPLELIFRQRNRHVGLVHVGIRKVGHVPVLRDESRVRESNRARTQSSLPP